MAIQLQPLRSDLIEAFTETFGAALGFNYSPALRERFTRMIDIDRFVVALDGEQVVGTLGAHTLPITVPGARLGMGGTTTVGVLSTHRRRGILRQLMAYHLEEVRARHEPLAGLWASEGSIYGRFGFGLAVERHRWHIPKPFADCGHPQISPGDMHWLTLEQSIERLPRLYESVAQRRIGLLARREAWWLDRILAEPPIPTAGMSEQRRVMLTQRGEAQGYVLNRTRRAHLESSLEVHVQELIALNDQAERTLWHYLFGIDLVESIEVSSLPVDHSLRFWIHDIRKIDRHVLDALWLRIVDVRAALRARDYAQPGRIVLKIVDSFCGDNQGVFALEVDSNRQATCESTHATPDIVCSVSALSSIYLGGFSWHDLARAGLVDATTDALVTADRLFRTHQAPWCAERF